MSLRQRSRVSETTTHSVQDQDAKASRRRHIIRDVGELRQKDTAFETKAQSIRDVGVLCLEVHSVCVEGTQCPRHRCTVSEEHSVCIEDTQFLRRGNTMSEINTHTVSEEYT